MFYTKQYPSDNTYQHYLHRIVVTQEILKEKLQEIQRNPLKTPWWQSKLIKWGAVTLIGCGGFTAAYFAYHKWFKK